MFPLLPSTPLFEVRVIPFLLLLCSTGVRGLGNEHDCNVLVPPVGQGRQPGYSQKVTVKPRATDLNAQGQGHRHLALLAVGPFWHGDQMDVLTTEPSFSLLVSSREKQILKPKETDLRKTELERCYEMCRLEKTILPL